MKTEKNARNLIFYILTNITKQIWLKKKEWNMKIKYRTNIDTGKYEEWNFFLHKRRKSDAPNKRVPKSQTENSNKNVQI